MKRLTRMLPVAGICLAIAISACTKAPQETPAAEDETPSGEVDDNKPAEEVSFTPEDLQTVDLGLSVKWASKNLEAVAPADAGGRFAWAEKTSKESFSWENYAWGDTMEKYNEKDGKLVIDPEDDAAVAALGGYWRMPTNQEWEELRSSSNCSWTWTQKDGISGYEVKSLRNMHPTGVRRCLPTP